MKNLYFGGQPYQAQQIVKNDDSIIGYVGGEAVFSFRGVTDFSGFTFAEGQEFDVSELTEIEKLRIEQAQANAELVQLIMMLGGA